ncbi:TspO/MBR family protein [Flavivirga spongiicola]|uniref:Tryptophan-rich sensory protein n=1 Tax=Flavivirga spongiicola TaxID=421621 RepID=A0ABU7XT44_9FLAO|nr:TspO/MBR family protein [Flavivirga sp. MEBiC05379]MDO5978950.1 TspO/MBR family protein [Flavivirga sp. MEBiC05379]
MIKRIIFFLFINFIGLGLGSIFTSDAVSSDWYQELNKAPWSPPGWVFGVAWTTIMICFALYLAYLFNSANQKRKRILFSIQWILNVGWSPLFFYFHAVTAALICILALTLLIAYLFFNYWKELRIKTLLLIPYFAWLIIATSLNAYILFYN